MNQKVKILVSPLNWGLGHATRLVPIIKALNMYGFDVYIAGNGKSFIYLKNLFPENKHFELRGISINYGKHKAFPLKFYLSIPLYFLSSSYDYFILKRLVKSQKLDCVISDNRFFLFNKKIFNIYLTHQLNIILPKKNRVLNALVNKIHCYIIKQFDECWIPDNEDYNLSGNLSLDRHRINPILIGTLSRFSNFEINDKSEHILYDFLVILSGPEPQRTIFENIVIEKFKHTKYRVVILRARPNDFKKTELSENMTFFNHVDDVEFVDLCKKSNTIICRSGYSTLMDLFHLKKKAIIIPTPGQTEQEYLADWFSKKFGFRRFSQNDFSIASIDEFQFTEKWDTNILESIIEKQIEKLKLKLNYNEDYRIYNS